MTITDFCRLLKHHIKLIIVIVLFSTLIGCVFGYMKAESSNVSPDMNENGDNYDGLLMARATILVSSQPGGVGGVANAEAERWNQENNERYGEWKVAESERMQRQIEASTNTSSKKSIENAPGSWLKTDYYKDFKDLTIVETQTLQGANVIYITAIGLNSDLCIEACNSVAERTESVAHDLYDGQSKQSGNAYLHLDESSSITIIDDRINIDVIKAEATTYAYPLIDDNLLLSAANRSTASQDSGSSANGAFKSMVKYGLLCFILGLVLSAIVVLIINLVRKPIINGVELAQSMSTPILSKPKTENDAEMLYANILLLVGDEASTVSIASINDSVASTSVFNKLTALNKSDGIRFTNAGSLSNSSDAIFAVAKSDGVVLCLREWMDSIPQFESSIDELSIANAKLIGMAIE